MKTEEVVQLLQEINTKLDVVLESLQQAGGAPAERKRVNQQEVVDALYEVMEDGTPRHITELHRLINEGDFLPLEISEQSLSSHCMKLFNAGSLVRPRKGVYGPILADEADETEQQSAVSSQQSAVSSQQNVA